MQSNSVSLSTENSNVTPLSSNPGDAGKKKQSRWASDERWALNVKLTSQRDKVVLLVLTMHTDRISGTSYPGIKTLVRECGGSRSSIIRALKNLVSGGFIRKLLCGRHNKYQLAPYYQNKDSESDTAPSNVVPIKIKNDEVTRKGCQSDTQTGVSLTSNRCHTDTLTDHKQIIGLNPIKVRNATCV